MEFVIVPVLGLIIAGMVVAKIVKEIPGHEKKWCKPKPQADVRRRARIGVDPDSRYFDGR